MTRQPAPSPDTSASRPALAIRTPPGTWSATGVDEEWERVLAPAGLDDAQARGHVRRLEHEELACKVEALRAYATQFPALDALAFRPLLNPETLRYEVFWPLG